jgi:hypothetical protein
MTTATIRYRMTSTYTKEIDLDSLDGTGAPTDDLGALADWLQDHHERAAGVDLLVVDNWVDTDPGSVEIDEVDAL